MTAQATDARPAEARAPALLAVEAVDVVLGRGWRANQVLSGVNLKIWPGEIVGLVGETGSGKTTLARTVVGLVKPRKGRVVVDGTETSGCAAARSGKSAVAVTSSSSSRIRCARSTRTSPCARSSARGCGSAAASTASEIKARVTSALRKVGLDATLLSRTPGQISGGQRQRVSIARALAADPGLLLCDEPVSALDASNRNYILRLLGDLRDSLNLPIVIISHDLSSLAGIADRVVVLYRGRIVEDGPVGQVFTAPKHPYTALLMASAPSVKHDRPLSIHQLRRTAADPDVGPDLSAASACVFAARCPFAIDVCAVQPALEPVAEADGGPGARPATGTTSGRRSRGTGLSWAPRASPAGAGSAG